MNTTPFLPSHLPKLYLSRYVCANTPLETGWQQAMAYLVLGLPADAVKELHDRNGTPLETAELAALWLLALEQSGALSEIIARNATEALRLHGWNEQSFELGLMHYNEARQFENALALWERYEAELQFTASANLLHNLACTLAGLENWTAALAIICEAAPDHLEPGDMLMDHDLEVLWNYYAAADPMPGEAAMLLSHEVSKILSEAASGHVLRSLTHHAVELDLPAHIRPWMHRGLSSQFSLDVDCPPEIHQLFYRWLEKQRQHKVNVLQKAIERAARVSALRSSSFV